MQWLDKINRGDKMKPYKDRSDEEKKKLAENSREYNKKFYENFMLVLRCGEKKKLKEHAQKNGESVNAFIKRAIQETMERDEMR